VNENQVLEIVGFAILRKEEQENKEKTREIVLSGIVVQDHNESIGKK
jgi:hypothetical protein